MRPITVIITARNAEKTIAATLNSLAGQRMKNFDILIIDDQSSDATAEIAKSYGSLMSVHVIHSDINLGVAAGRNLALQHCDTPYVAYLDADDLAHPERLERQYAFMEQHREIDVCSSAMMMFYESEDRDMQTLIKPADDAVIKTALIQYCALSHGSSLIRRDFYQEVGTYDVKLDFAEDYDLWCRGALIGKKFTNLQEPLTYYRQHAGQVGKNKRQLQYERDLSVKRHYIENLISSNDAAMLPRFFSLLSVFESPPHAVQALTQSMLPLIKLSNSVPCMNTYIDIVNRSIHRHFNASS